MVKVEQSGAGRAKPAGNHRLNINPADYDLSQFLCAYPGSQYNKGLENISAFDRLSVDGDSAQLEYLVNWIEPHTTVAWIMEHHGANGVKRVLRGIAKAAVKFGTAMKPRVYHTAECLGLVE